MRPLLTCGLALAAACGGERDRPAPLDPTEGPLQATITAPIGNDSVSPGAVISVTVAGQDPLLRSLVGLGIVVRRVDEGAHQTLDSTVLRFDARASNSAVFEYAMPAVLPFGAVVNVYGLAFGSGERAHESAPRSFVVENCEAEEVPCD